MIPSLQSILILQMKHSKINMLLEEKQVRVQGDIEKPRCSDIITNFLFGYTGSGKSTFINYMMGVQYKRIKRGYYYFLMPKDENTIRNKSVISFNTASQAEVPEAYEHEGTIWHDFAGFLNARGSKLEIQTAYCSTKMFKFGHRARIILMIEQSSLQSCRGLGIVEAANRLSQLLGQHLQQVADCFTILVSKAGTDLSADKAIKELLQISSNLKKESKAKFLLEAACTKLRVFLFTNDPDKQNREKLKEQLLLVPTFQITSETNISLSHEASAQVQNFRRSVEEELSAETVKISQTASFNFDRRFEDANVLISKIRQLKEVEVLLNREPSSACQAHFEKAFENLQIPAADCKNFFKLYKKTEYCSTLIGSFQPIHKFQQDMLFRTRQLIAKLETSMKGPLSHVQFRSKHEHENEWRQAEKKRFIEIPLNNQEKKGHEHGFLVAFERQAEMFEGMMKQMIEKDEKIIELLRILTSRQKQTYSRQMV